MSKSAIRAIFLQVPPIRRLWDHASALAESRDAIARELADAREEVEQLKLAQDERATHVWRLEHEARVRHIPEESLRMYVMRSDLQRAQATISRQRGEINDLRGETLALGEANRRLEREHASLAVQIGQRRAAMASSMPEALLEASFALDDLRGRIADPDIRSNAHEELVERLAVLAHDLGQASLRDDADKTMLVALQARYLDVLERLLILRQTPQDRDDSQELARVRAVLDRALREEGAGDYLQVGGNASSAILARGAFISAGFKRRTVRLAEAAAQSKLSADQVAEVKIAFHRFGLLDDGVQLNDADWTAQAAGTSILNLVTDDDEALTALNACYDSLPVGCYIVGPYGGEASPIGAFLRAKGVTANVVELGGKRGLWRRHSDWAVSSPRVRNVRAKTSR
jgi:hypothetical protein